MKKVVIIGSGFAGLSAASFMAKSGWDVTVLEKNEGPGGRARQLKVDGFIFDMGPSWYWMPDVFEWFFGCFDKKVSDYYQLKRLDPSYKVFYPEMELEIPADYTELRNLFEELEAGAAEKLDQFLEEAKYKYEVGIHKLVHKPGKSLLEFADLSLAKGVLKLDVFTSMSRHVKKFFKNDALQHLMEFPVLFLGALPKQIPALYSLMNYADIKLGTWYPENGMYSVTEGMHKLAESLGVKFLWQHNVTEIVVENKVAKMVLANVGGKQQQFEADVVIANADYHFVETNLLKKEQRSYTEAYWQKRVMAPSCLIYYVGLNKKIDGLLHHSLFFDVDFQQHGEEIYTSKEWPKEPLFYVSGTSVTDVNAAPAGCENLFFLIPVAAGLSSDTEELREKYFKQIVKRFEDRVGEKIVDNIIYKKTYAVADFVSDYNSFKGNAYGLANTLTQTAILKPKMHSKKVKNLFYTGQLTVPGPGVPPSLISGKIVAEEVVKLF